MGSLSLRIPTHLDKTKRDGILSLRPYSARSIAFMRLTSYNLPLANQPGEAW